MKRGLVVLVHPKTATDIDMREFGNGWPTLSKFKARGIKAKADGYLAPRLLVDAIIGPSESDLRPVKHERAISSRCCESLGSE